VTGCADREGRRARGRRDSQPGAQHDIVVITALLTGQTRHLVDQEFLSAMPDGAMLVNAGAGPDRRHRCACPRTTGRTTSRRARRDGPRTLARTPSALDLSRSDHQPPHGSDGPRNQRPLLHRGRRADLHVPCRGPTFQRRPRTHRPHVVGSSRQYSRHCPARADTVCSEFLFLFKAAPPGPPTRPSSPRTAKRGHAADAGPAWRSETGRATRSRQGRRNMPSPGRQAPG
jgi:hypothetical protein